MTSTQNTEEVRSDTILSSDFYFCARDEMMFNCDEYERIRTERLNKGEINGEIDFDKLMNKEKEAVCNENDDSNGYVQHFSSSFMNSPIMRDQFEFLWSEKEFKKISPDKKNIKKTINKNNEFGLLTPKETLLRITQEIKNSNDTWPNINTHKKIGSRKSETYGKEGFLKLKKEDRSINKLREKNKNCSKKIAKTNKNLFKNIQNQNNLNTTQRKEKIFPLKSDLFDKKRLIESENVLDSDLEEFSISKEHIQENFDDKKKEFKKYSLTKNGDLRNIKTLYPPLNHSAEKMKLSEINKKVSLEKSGSVSFNFNNMTIRNKRKIEETSFDLSLKTGESFLNMKPFHWAVKEDENLSKRIFSAPGVKKIANRRHSSIHKIWDRSDSGVRHTLDHKGPGKDDAYMRIEPETIKKLICENRKNYLVIDCRFEYEYKGGHIINAINISSLTEIEKFYTEYMNTRKTDNDNTLILIFHCEFSSVRAPRMAKHFRSYDRTKNEYPKLAFPEIYILEGGYKRFYNECKEMCEPVNYVTMDAKEYQEECKNEHKKLKRQK